MIKPPRGLVVYRRWNVCQNEAVVGGSPKTDVALAHRDDVPGMAYAHVPFNAAVRQPLSGTPGMSLGRKRIGLCDSCRESGGSDGAGQERSGDYFPHSGSFHVSFGK